MSYLERLKTEFSENNLHKELTKLTKASSVSFVSNKIGHISEKLDRWSPKLSTEGYVWCLDCQHWGGTACTHTDNPFRNQQPSTPRKCRWYE